MRAAECGGGRASPRASGARAAPLDVVLERSTDVRRVYWSVLYSRGRSLVTVCFATDDRARSPRSVVPIGIRSFAFACGPVPGE